jgi:hypothetical protein
MKLGIVSKKDPVEKQRIKCRKKFLHYFKMAFPMQLTLAGNVITN